jgi:hypothetical protein
MSLNLRPQQIDTIRTVFLGATAQDLREDRESISTALKFKDTAVFLQEYWSGGLANVVAECRRRVFDAHAYLGLFGYRYGWIPPDHEKSITELECDFAFERWNGLSEPPIFLFVPDADSEAAQELLNRAEQTLVDEYPHDPGAQECSKQRQTEFRVRLQATGRINTFRKRPELPARAVAAVSNWNELILKSAFDGRRAASSDIPPSELGEIGRQDQVEALEDALIALSERIAEGRGVPGMCVLIHGEEMAGQRAFVEHLRDWDGWNRSKPVPVGALHNANYEPRSLISLAHGLVAPGREITHPDFESLATSIHSECAKEPQVLVLQNLNRFRGGLSAFHERFWVPLYGALQYKWADEPRDNGFTMVVVENEGLPALPPTCVWASEIDDEAVDYTKLLPLPELGDLEADDVREWLRELGVKPKPARSIAQRVTANAKGAEDGTPLNVFERLNQEGIWAMLH